MRDIQMREQQTMQDGSIFVKKLKISLITNEENKKEKRYDCKNLLEKGWKVCRIFFGIYYDA